MPIKCTGIIMHVLPHRLRNEATDIDCSGCGLLLRVYDHEWLDEPQRRKWDTPQSFVSCTVCGARNYKIKTKETEDAIHDAPCDGSSDIESTIETTRSTMDQEFRIPAGSTSPGSAEL